MSRTYTTCSACSTNSLAQGDRSGPIQCHRYQGRPIAQGHGSHGYGDGMNAYPKASIKLCNADGVHRVQSCMVWLNNGFGQLLGSGENYESKEAAVVDMKQRTMTLLRESGRAESEHSVNWVIESE